MGLPQTIFKDSICYLYTNLQQCLELEILNSRPAVGAAFTLHPVGSLLKPSWSIKERGCGKCCLLKKKKRFTSLCLSVFGREQAATTSIEGNTLARPLLKTALLGSTLSPPFPSPIQEHIELTATSRLHLFLIHPVHLIQCYDVPWIVTKSDSAETALESLGKDSTRCCIYVTLLFV